MNNEYDKVNSYSSTENYNTYLYNEFGRRWNHKEINSNTNFEERSASGAKSEPSNSNLVDKNRINLFINVKLLERRSMDLFQDYQTLKTSHENTTEDYSPINKLSRQSMHSRFSCLLAGEFANYSLNIKNSKCDQFISDNLMDQLKMNSNQEKSVGGCFQNCRSPSVDETDESCRSCTLNAKSKQDFENNTPSIIQSSTTSEVNTSSDEYTYSAKVNGNQDFKNNLPSKARSSAISELNTSSCSNRLGEDTGDSQSDISKFSGIITRYYHELCERKTDKKSVGRLWKEWNEDDAEFRAHGLNAILSFGLCNDGFKADNDGINKAFSNFNMLKYHRTISDSIQKIETISSEPKMHSCENNVKDLESSGSIKSISVQSTPVSSSCKDLGSLRQEKCLKSLFLNGSYNPLSCKTEISKENSTFNIIGNNAYKSLDAIKLCTSMEYNATAEFPQMKPQFFTDSYYLKKKFENEIENCLTKQKSHQYGEENYLFLGIDRKSSSALRFQDHKYENWSQSRIFNYEHNFSNVSIIQSKISGIDASTDALDKIKACNYVDFGTKRARSKIDYCFKNNSFPVKNDDQASTRKTLEVLYPVKSRKSVCFSNNYEDGLDDDSISRINDKSEISLSQLQCHIAEKCKNYSELLKEELEEEMGSEKFATGYNDKEAELITATVSDSWSVFTSESYEERISRCDSNIVDIKHVLNRVEFKDEVVNVLEGFLKKNVLVSNVKGRDFDVFIIPKEKPANVDDEDDNRITDANEYVTSETRCSQLYNRYSSGSRVFNCYYDTDHRSRSSSHSSVRKIKKKIKKRDVDGFPSCSKRKFQSFCEHYRKDLEKSHLVGNHFQSWPSFDLNRVRSAHMNCVSRDISFNRNSFQKPPSGMRVETPTYSSDKKTFYHHSFGDHLVKCSKPEELIKASTPKKKRRKHKSKKFGALIELNKFKEVLSEVEHRQNALLQMLNSDPCGLLYSFSRDSNLQISHQSVESN